MALLDDLTKGASSPAGLVAGMGTVLLTPVLVPAVSRLLYPGVKSLMRSGITLYRSAMEPLAAALGGLVAKAQMELARANAVPSRTPPPAPAQKPQRQRHRKDGHRENGHRDGEPQP